MLLAAIWVINRAWQIPWKFHDSFLLVWPLWMTLAVNKSWLSSLGAHKISQHFSPVEKILHLYGFHFIFHFTWTWILGFSCKNFFFKFLTLKSCFCRSDAYNFLWLNPWWNIISDKIYTKQNSTIIKHVSSNQHHKLNLECPAKHLYIHCWKEKVIILLFL